MSMTRVLTAVGGVLLIAAVAVAVVTGIHFWKLNAEEDARDSAVAAAREYTETMFSYNPKTVSDSINKSMGFLTGSAKDEYQKNVGDNDVATKVKNQKIVTVVTIQGAAAMSNTRDTAKVLVYVNQSSTRNKVEDVQVDQSRIVYDMVRRDGAWLISAIDILDDDSLKSRLQQENGPVPSGAVPIPSAPATTSVTPAP